MSIQQDQSHDVLSQGKDGLWALCFRNHKNHAEPNVVQIFSKYGPVANVRSHGAWTFIRFARKEEAEAALNDEELINIVSDRVIAARHTVGKAGMESSSSTKSNAGSGSQSSKKSTEKGAKPKQKQVHADNGSTDDEDWGEPDPSPHGRFMYAPTGRANPINIQSKAGSELEHPPISLQQTESFLHPPPQQHPNMQQNKTYPQQNKPHFQQNKPHPNYQQGRQTYPNNQPPPNMQQQQYPTDGRPEFQHGSFPHPNPNFNRPQNTNQRGGKNFRGFRGGNQHRGAFNPIQNSNNGQQNRPNSFGGPNQSHFLQGNEYLDEEVAGFIPRPFSRGPASIVNGNCMPKMSNILNNGVQARQYEGQNLRREQDLFGGNQKQNNPNQFQRKQQQGGNPAVKQSKGPCNAEEGREYFESYVVGNYGDHVQLEELYSIFNGDDIADITMHRSPCGRNFCIVYVTSEDRASSLMALNDRILLGPNKLTVNSAEHFISIGLDQTCNNAMQYRGNAPPTNRTTRKLKSDDLTLGRLHEEKFKLILEECYANSMAFL